MNAYEIYNHYKSGYGEVLQIAENVIATFEYYYGSCGFPPYYDSLTKLYMIITSGYGDIIWSALKRLDYSYSFEIQTILASIDALVRNHISVITASNWTCYYSIDNIKKIGSSYALETKEGKLITTPLTEYKENEQIFEYTNRRSYYGFCHDAVERFLRENPEYQAVTSLMPHQFGRKHFHSYVKKEGKIIDFSHNACIDEETYNQILKPIPLNTVYGYQLEEEKNKLGKDDIGEEKCLLVRLAISKQRKK